MRRAAAAQPIVQPSTVPEYARHAAMPPKTASDRPANCRSMRSGGGLITSCHCMLGSSGHRAIGPSGHRAIGPSNYLVQLELREVLFPRLVVQPFLHVFLQ